MASDVAIHVSVLTCAKNDNVVDSKRDIEGHSLSRGIIIIDRNENPESFK